MTKQETTALLEAVKNAPIVDGKITVTVCGTTFSFGGRNMFCNNLVTEENRQKLLEAIEHKCKMRFTSSIPKKELDAPGLKSQNRIVHKMLYQYVIDNHLKTTKYSENFYFILMPDGKYKYLSREDKAKAVEFAKSISKKRSDVFVVSA